MISELNFTENAGVWIANFISQGNTVIEIERTKPSTILILANLEGMKPVIVGSYPNNYSNNAIFNIQVPKGIEVTIESPTEVIDAKLQIED